MIVNILLTLYALLCIYFMVSIKTPRIIQAVVSISLGLLVGDLWS